LQTEWEWLVTVIQIVTKKWLCIINMNLKYCYILFHNIWAFVHSLRYENYQNAVGHTEDDVGKGRLRMIHIGCRCCSLHMDRLSHQAQWIQCYAHSMAAMLASSPV
jgi:hypothetical protein